MLNLLLTLDTKNTPDSDNIPVHILQLIAEEIAPILNVIYKIMQSLNSGLIPKDCLPANITPVFRKGDKSS